MRALMLDGGDRTPYLSRLVARLAREGVEMHYAGDPGWKDFGALQEAGVRCHAMRVRHKLDPWARFSVRRLLDEHRIELLHTIMSRDAYVGIKARGRRPVRVLVRKGAYTRLSRFDPADRVIYGRRGADAFLAVSRDLVRHMVGRGVAPERVTNIYTGIWSDALQPAERDLRSELGIDGDGLLLALVGNLRPVKGLDYLLAGLGGLARQGVPFHLLIAGEGYDTARDAIRASGIEDRVRLLGFQSDVMTLMSNVDCLVHPSRIDALPRAVIEATVVGTPVIATRVGGIPEILDDGRSGVLVDPEDPGSLTKALRKANDDPESLRALAAAARDRNRERFGIESCARQHLDLYERMLSGETVGPPSA